MMSSAVWLPKPAFRGKAYLDWQNELGLSQ